MDDKKDLIQIDDSDFSGSEKKELAEFRLAGLPGIGRYSDTDITKWFSLYLSGKTYMEISQISKTDIAYILYFSEKLKWHPKKTKYYDNIVNNMAQKVSQSKIDGINILTTAVSGLSKFFGDKITEAIMNNDDGLIQNTDLLKNLHKWTQMIETIDKLTAQASSKKPGSGPAVNVNVFTKSEEKTTVEINQNEKKENGSILRKLSDLKKENSKK